MAQSVEHVIGNDEVISSILITSSKRSNPIGLLLFLFPSDLIRHILTMKEVVIIRTPNNTLKGAEACIAEFGSLTVAMKAQSVLASAAIPSFVEKLESSSSRRGCAYGLRLSCLQQNNARSVLKAARISVKQWNTES